jgi:uroporphyrin-3 C-methyltransferase
LAFAVLLGLVALGATGFVAWRGWQLEQRGAAGAQTLDSVRQQIAAQQQELASIRDERNSLRQRMADADTVNRSLREEVLGVTERTRNVEDAVANLSERALTGHDSMLLDETESLLRMAKERYDLFHDAAGAQSAYELADRSLAAVGDNAFSSVRSSLASERAALAAVKPAARAQDLAAISVLRDQLPALPLKALDTPAAASDTQGFWARVGSALAHVVTIRRDDGSPVSMADAHLARELASLDLAQAQAALLGYDDDARTAALRRVDATLAAQFDNGDAAVRVARAGVARMIAEGGGAAAPQLGAALAELRNLRSVHALKPPAPAAATSAASPAQATP